MIWPGTGGASPWLGRFEHPALLRAQGAFQIGATRERGSGLPRVVVCGAPGRDPSLQGQALARLAQAHRRLQHPRIAPVAGDGEADGVPFVALDCDAEVDLGTLLREARRIDLCVPHAQADGFILGLRQALQEAHRAGAPGPPLCLQDLAYGNVLFNRAGQHWLLGFGHNVVTRDEQGALLAGEPTFRSPEVNLGGAPSPSGDFVALILMMRSMLPAVSLAPAVGRALVGLSFAEDAELLRCLLWFERRVIAALPSQRATIEEAVEVSDRIRSLLGVVPDPQGFEQTVAAAVARLLPGSSRGELTVGPDALWMEPPDRTRQPLGTRTALRRVLLALTAARLQSPGEVLSTEALLEAGWPGERPAPEAGANRVHVLLSELRRRGLREALQRHGDGYRLDPSIPIRLVG
jgi:hypothetical protein